MNIRQVSCALLAGCIGSTFAQPSVSTDSWDISQGSTVTSSSGIIPGYSVNAMFGELGQNNGNGNTWTYFADGQPPGFVHFVEWQTPAPVELGQVRLYAFGDDFLNDSREFDQFTLKTKSPGSSTFDVTLITYMPTHPYTFVDAGNFLILDQLIPSVTAQEFRAEFVQYTAGNGFDGPRIVELDGLPTPPPQPPHVVTQPVGAVVNYNTPVIFTVEATGAGRLHFQWYKDGVALPDETKRKLRIHAVKPEDAGVYHVAITDDNGTTTSADANLSLDLYTIRPSSFDLWDSQRNIVITDHSDYHSSATYPLGMFGTGNPLEDSDVTYFGDGQAPGTVHYVEWTTTHPVNVKAIRLFAHGDDFLNNGREFSSVTIKAKSPGSSTFDLTLGTFTPTHPYTFLDWSTFAILDIQIPATEASAFRAEFEQFDAGFGFDGPRIVELDAFSSRPLTVPVVVVAPESLTVEKGTPVTLHVQARGGNLHYQWKVNGQNINEHSDTLVIGNVQLRDQGQYTVEVTNDLGSTESAPGLLLVTRP